MDGGYDGTWGFPFFACHFGTLNPYGLYQPPQAFVTSEGYDYHYAEGLDGIWRGMLERETEQFGEYVEVFNPWDFFLWPQYDSS
jgi:hypothetical protein